MTRTHSSNDASPLSTRPAGGPRSRRAWALAAAAAAVPLLAALPARAQFPVPNGGHAHDANNQVGSGGYNTGAGSGGTINNNNIIYNNLTGGRGFQGRLQETDPGAFRQILPGSGVDHFAAVSNPSAARGTPSANALSPTVQPYYGESRGVVPPGYVQNVGGTGYVPPGTPQASTYTYQLGNAATGGGYATGAALGGGSVGNVNPTLGINGAYVPYGGDVIRLNTGDQQTLLAVSPGFGVQQVPLDNSANGYFQSRTINRTSPDRLQRPDPQQLQQMQLELEQGQVPAPPAPTGTPLNPNSPPPTGPGQLNRPLPLPLETPGSQAIPNQPLGAAVGTAQPFSGGVDTQQGLRRTLVGPGQQTPVYNELKDRLGRYETQNPALAAAEANTQFDRGRRARDAGTPRTGSTGDNPARPGAPGTPAGVRPAPGSVGGAGTGLPGRTAPGGATRPGTPPPDTSGMSALAGGTKTEPVHVASLAAGVKAKGLGGLLQAAESLMKQGKFTSASEQYTLARQVAPNNPLIVVGQANAELGALSYRNAELFLRQAFAGDPALLHAQFDGYLRATLGDERVKTITADLAGLAQKEPGAEMPAFLLAYLSYNTGHEATAMKWLDDVEKREGRADPVVQRMREHWYVPPAKPPTAPAAPAVPGGPALNK